MLGCLCVLRCLYVVGCLCLYSYVSSDVVAMTANTGYGG